MGFGKADVESLDGGVESVSAGNEDAALSGPRIPPGTAYPNFTQLQVGPTPDARTRPCFEAKNNSEGRAERREWGEIGGSTSERQGGWRGYIASPLFIL